MTLITPVYSLCLAYESGFGHGVANDKTVNPYAADSREFEAYDIGRRRGIEKQSTASVDLPHDPRDITTRLAFMARGIEVQEGFNWFEYERLCSDARKYIDRLRWLLRQILDVIPANRDWLNPDLEREARERSGCADPVYIPSGDPNGSREGRHTFACHKSECKGECVTGTAAPRRVRFDDAPLGTRFTYVEDTDADVWVKLGNGDTGAIAKWEGVDGPTVGQIICSFADTPAERAFGLVVLAEHLPDEPAPATVTFTASAFATQAALAQADAWNRDHYQGGALVTGARYELVQLPSPPYEFRGDSGKIECPMCAGDGDIYPPDTPTSSAETRALIAKLREVQMCVKLAACGDEKSFQAANARIGNALAMLEGGTG